MPAGLFYLDDEAFEAAKRRLTREAMLEQLRRDEATIAVLGPAAPALKVLAGPAPRTSVWMGCCFLIRP